MSAVKICGLCRPGDAALAAAAGARYAGVVLVPGRSRTQTLGAARRILAAAGPLARVGVFADQATAEIAAAVEALALDVVQLHGAEPPAQLGELRAAGVPRIWKAVAVTGDRTVPAAAARYAGLADGFLLDSGGGGTGRPFAWSDAAGVRAVLPPGSTLVLAGGLNPGNAAAALAALQPDILDVSSGVESAPGCKSADAMRAFVAAARGSSRGEG